MGVKLAVDIGGTFTDLIFIDEDSKELNVVKVPSKPNNPEKAVEDGLEKIKALYGVQPQAACRVGDRVVEIVALDEDGVQPGNASAASHRPGAFEQPR